MAFGERLPRRRGAAGAARRAAPPTSRSSWSTGTARELTAVITHTIERWDGKEAARRIELHVGRDLQFIRINGTIVGGLVGVLIHAVAVARALTADPCVLRAECASSTRAECHFLRTGRRSASDRHSARSSVLGG